jgi:hypothetical protein
MNEFADRFAGAVVRTGTAIEHEFEASLAEWSRLAFRVAFSVLRQREDAEDVAQDALTKAHRQLGQLRVQVTIVRYSGDKKTASLPFTLWVNANDEPTMLNAGQSVPVPSTHFASAGAANTPPTSYNFQPVGTRITCQATPTADGRFKLTLGIRDSYPAPAKTSGDIVSLKSLETHNSLVLRSGQTAEFVAVTDMISGDVTRIEVTATVLK